MKTKLIGLNIKTGVGAIEARRDNSTALIDFRIRDDGSVSKGWVKYSTTARDLASFPAEVKELNIEEIVKSYPDYFVFTKKEVTACWL